MENKMGKIYEEVRCDYHDPEGFWAVDAWYPHKEEGLVIAVINDVNGGVYAINDLDENAKQVIAEKVKEIKEYAKEINEASYRLNVMLGTIRDEMERGGDAVTQKEIEELYELSSIINQ